MPALNRQTVIDADVADHDAKQPFAACTPSNSRVEQAVTDALKAKGGYWRGPRDYVTMTPDRVFRQLADVFYAVLQHNPTVDTGYIYRAYEHSLRFAQRAFDDYAITDGSAYGGAFDSVFAVPCRVNGTDEVYSTDTDAFLPILSREFGITPEIQLRGVLGIPPCVIETNTQGSTRGATIFVPLFGSMLADYRDDPGTLLHIGNEIIKKAAELTHVRLGANLLGLGATIPKISGYGSMFKQHDRYDMNGLVTTTGHGGTVFLIGETIRALQETRTFGDRAIRLGVIGAAGSIGWSTVASVLELVGDFEVYATDHRFDVLAERISAYRDRAHIHQTAAAMGTLHQADIIVAAVTRPIDLDQVDPIDHRVPIGERSLAGKVIIDDSEPKAFRRDQVEARGGYLINVVGQGGPDFADLRRDGRWTGGPDHPYNFGDLAGVYGGASWGCDIERTVLSWADAADAAVTADVTPGDVRSISRLCHAAGVGVAPFQINSQPVAIP